jgi:hypothetical protein
VTGGIIVLYRVRGFDGYKRRFANGAGKFAHKPAHRDAAHDSSIYMAPIIGGTVGGHSHESADCGAGHGGDGGGGCAADGGGGS